MISWHVENGECCMVAWYRYRISATAVEAEWRLFQMASGSSSSQHISQHAGNPHFPVIFSGRTARYVTTSRLRVFAFPRGALLSPRIRGMLCQDPRSWYVGSTGSFALRIWSLCLPSSKLWKFLRIIFWRMTVPLCANYICLSSKKCAARMQTHASLWWLRNLPIAYKMCLPDLSSWRKCDGMRGTTGSSCGSPKSFQNQASLILGKEGSPCGSSLLRVYVVKWLQFGRNSVHDSNRGIELRSNQFKPSFGWFWWWVCVAHFSRCYSGITR